MGSVGTVAFTEAGGVMSDREHAFAQYEASLGARLGDVDRESAQADFNAGWDAARAEAGR